MINPLQNIMPAPVNAPGMEVTTSAGHTPSSVSDLAIKDFKSLIEKYAELLPPGEHPDPHGLHPLGIAVPQGIILPQEGKSLPDQSALQMLRPDESLKKLLLPNSPSTSAPTIARDLVNAMPSAMTETLPSLELSASKIHVMIAKDANSNGANQTALNMVNLQQHALSTSDVPVTVTKEGFNIQTMTQLANAMTQLNQSAPLNSNPVQAQTITTPVGHQQWSGDVGNRVVWMAQQNIQSADIKLNPPHLGPMEVRVSLGNDNNVSVSFTSHHAQVREALDTAMPRLRDMLMDNGLQLADANVSHRQTPNQDQARQDSDAEGRYPTEAGFDDSEMRDKNKEDSHQALLRMRLVDYYA